MNTVITICSILCTVFVKSFGPQVMLKPQNASAWQQPVSGQMVSRMDSVLIPKGEQLTLVDDTDNTVYECSSPQKGNVNQCMVLVKNNANNMLLGLAAQIKDNALGNHKTARLQPIYGGTTRAEDEDLKNDSIACLVLSAARSDTNRLLPLNLRTVSDGEYISFTVENHSSEAYYINIIAVHIGNGMVSLCIVPSPETEAEVLLLPPAQEMDLSMFRFLKSAEINYCLFATQTPFSPSSIQSILRYPEDLNCPE